jgi:uncharacterized protein YraI
MTPRLLCCTASVLLLLAGGALAKPGTVRSTTNLRANPDTASAILGTIPGGARLELGECKEGWCAVTYQGQSGHVIQSAVSTGTRTVRRAPAKRVARAAPPPGYRAPPGYAPPGSIHDDDDDFEPAYPVGPRVYVGPPVVYGPGPYWGPGPGYYRPWGWGPGWGWRRW